VALSQLNVATAKDLADSAIAQIKRDSPFDGLGGNE